MSRTPLTLLVLSALAATSPLAAQKEPDFFFGTFEAALAKVEEKPAKLMFLYCWQASDDERLWSQTVTSPEVVKALGDFLCYSAKKDDPIGQSLFERYKVRQSPTMLFVNGKGEVVDVLAGFITAGDLLQELERIRKGEGTILALREAVATKPDDVKSQFALAQKLQAVGDEQGYDQIVEAILKADPKARTEEAALILLDRICKETFRPEVLPEDVNLKPLKDFLVKQKNKRALFLGYDRIAAAEYRRQDLKAAVQAVKRAWKYVPDDELMEWGARVATKVWEHQRELSKGDLKLALQIATKVLKAHEKVKKDAEPNWNQMHAYYTYVYGIANYVNGKRKEAIAALEKCAELDPGYEDYKKFLEGMKAGNLPVPKGFSGSDK